MELKPLIESLLADDKFTRGAGLGMLSPSGSFLTQNSTIDILSGDNMLLFAGPPLEQQARDFPQYLLPIGTATVFAQQNVRQWLPVSEFGNQYTYHVPNKMQYSLSISRIQTARGDLYRSFAQWLMFHWQDLHYGDPAYDVTGMTWQERPNPLKNGNENVVGETQITNPGSEYTLMPFGILQVEYTADYRVVRKAYCENCKLAAVSRGKSAGSPVSEESGQILVTRVSSTEIAVDVKPKTSYSVSPAFPNESRSGGVGASTSVSGSGGGGSAQTGTSVQDQELNNTL